MRYRVAPVFRHPRLLNGLSHVRRDVAAAPRKAGFDANYMAATHAAWKAVRQQVKLHDRNNGREAA